MITILIILCLFLAPLGLGITGIVLGSLDIAKNIIDAKSICFLVFGIIGTGIGMMTLKAFME